MKIVDLLNAAKNAGGIESDYALAKILGINKGRVSAYYSGKEAPNEWACLKISEITGMPLDTVIATVKAESEKDETRREAWENYMKRLGGVAASFAAVCLMVVTLIVTCPTAEAAVKPFDYANSLVIQIMRCFTKVIEAARRIVKMLLLHAYWSYSPNDGITA